MNGFGNKDHHKYKTNIGLLFRKLRDLGNVSSTDHIHMFHKVYGIIT